MALATLLFLATLFVLLSIAPLGFYISKSVPDEVPRARKYVELGIDSVFLIMIGFSIWSFELHALAIAVPVGFAFARRVWPLRRVYAPVSGIIIAASSLTSIQEPMLISCLALNFGIGITAKDKTTLAKELWLQPLAAITILVILRLTQPI